MKELREIINFYFKEFNELVRPYESLGASEDATQSVVQRAVGLALLGDPDRLFGDRYFYVPSDPSLWSLVGGNRIQQWEAAKILQAATKKLIDNLWSSIPCDSQEARQVLREFLPLGSLPMLDYVFFDKKRRDRQRQTDLESIIKFDNIGNCS